MYNTRYFGGKTSRRNTTNFQVKYRHIVRQIVQENVQQKVLQKVQQKEHNSYVALFIKQFVITKLVVPS